MSEPDNAPEVTMVPVTKHEVQLSLSDLLEPLTQTTRNLSRARVSMVQDPEVAEQLQQFTQLVTELKEVSSRLERMDPQLLVSRPTPPVE